ncbi:SHC-transforming protein 3 [Spea bombifrons]|uniref:SHC-transforming protein 3 n=1 Tax=Spea bombifrons TaxID=233779 RepID=UPI00234ACA22|nr:SHC-transforming protein 3 [Spea bombifrons]
MLQRTKYNRFKNESVTPVDDLLHNLSMNSKVSTEASTTVTTPCSVPTEVLQKDQEDGTAALCTFIHKVSHLKLHSSGSLLGIKNISSAVKELAGSKLQGSSPALSSAAGISDNTCNLVSTPPGSQQDVSKMSTGKKTRSEEMHLGSDDWNQSSSFVNKPSRGWLHSNEKILGPGVTYIVKYLGCIEVLRSMRSLDFNTRTQITREAFNRVCEAVPGTKGVFKKRKPASKILSSILGKSNLQFAGMSITLNISTTSLNMMTPDSKQIIANHHMQSISFASGGDPDATDYVAYVAKDPVNRRACHILECCDGLAQEVISTIGQAFELRFKQYLQCPSKIPVFPDRMQSLDDPLWPEDEGAATEPQYYNSIPNKMPPPGGIIDERLKTQLPNQGDISQFANSPGVEQGYYQGRHLSEKSNENFQQAIKRQASLDIYSQPEGKLTGNQAGNAPTYVNTQHINMKTLGALQRSIDGSFCGSIDSSRDANPRKDLFDMKPFEDALRNQPVLSKDASVDCSSPLLSRAAILTISEELKSEPWYVGEMCRKEAEMLLKRDGDFLVRKSVNNPGSYVLTGMHHGQAKHLLLVDPEGTVRTKDRVFDSIGHLINHHLENNLPIVSSGTELCLKQSADGTP